MTALCKLTEKEDLIRKFIDIVMKADKDLMITIPALIDRIEKHISLTKSTALKTHMTELLKLLKMRSTEQSYKILLKRIVVDDPNGLGVLSGLIA
jgi:hypothetical protein